MCPPDTRSAHLPIHRFDVDHNAHSFAHMSAVCNRVAHSSVVRMVTFGIVVVRRQTARAVVVFPDWNSTHERGVGKPSSDHKPS